MANSFSPFFHTDFPLSSRSFIRLCFTYGLFHFNFSLLYFTRGARLEFLFFWRDVYYRVMFREIFLFSLCQYLWPADRHDLSFLKPNYSWPLIHLAFLFSHLWPGALHISLRTHKTQPRGWRKRTNELTRTWISSKSKRREFVTNLCRSSYICSLSGACILHETSQNH